MIINGSQAKSNAEPSTSQAVQHSALSGIDPILRLPDVEALTGLKKSTLYQLMAKGEFIRSVRLSARAVGWRTSELKAWLSARTGS